MSQTGGGRANKSGNTLEQMVETILLQNGYKKTPNRNFGVHVVKQKPVYFRQLVVGKTIYNTDYKVDFFVYSHNQHPKGLIVECKWQQANGSVDEKYPFLVQNLARTREEAVIVLDGGGYKPGARDWLLAQANKRKKLSVFSLAGFTRWANGGGI